MFLKPFTYPLPETRFLHAGRSVYKLKIRYGNFLCYKPLKIYWYMLSRGLLAILTALFHRTFHLHCMCSISSQHYRAPHRATACLILGLQGPRRTFSVIAPLH
uniref:Uncharacterized protein n=2 Tax=Gopherus TaxID=38771 RepID=A0A8C4VLE5_9SAUR